MVMDIEEFKKEILKDGVFRVDGGLNSAFLKNRAPHYDWSSLEGDTIQEKIYILFNGRPRCPICGKKTPFGKRWSQGFNVTCSKECKKEYDRITLKNNIRKLSTDEVKEKRKRTCLERYGTENVFQNEDVKKKIRRTLMDRYSVEHPSQNPSIRYKMKKTSIERYGVPFYTQTEEYLERSKNTCMEKYGKEYYFQSSDCRSRAESLYMRKYGVPCNLMSPEVKERIKETNIRLYGVEYPMQNSSIRRKSLSGKVMTSPEKKMNEFLRNRGFEFEYQYMCNDKCFDFAIFREGSLSILVEIDGEYFHGLSEDPNDKHVKGFTDPERFLNCPEGVKLIICDSKKVEESFEEILNIFSIDYEKWISDIVGSLPCEFPYPFYSEERMKKDFRHLCEWEDVQPRGRLCDSIIRNFHRSLWNSHRKGFPSPYEAWQDRSLLEKCVRNRFIYKSNLSSQNILDGFNVCKLAPRVSVFSCSLSKYLIRKYLDGYNEIFDPFSGFSGRMIGSISCNKRYIGQDIDRIRIEESSDILEFLKSGDVDLSIKDILNSSGEYECLFTCPPYGDKEIWGSESVFRSCDEWIDECLQRFKCGAYLFVVDDTEKYRDSVVEKLQNRSHLGTNEEKVVLVFR